MDCDITVTLDQQIRRHSAFSKGTRKVLLPPSRSCTLYVVWEKKLAGGNEKRQSLKKEDA